MGVAALAVSQSASSAKCDALSIYHLEKTVQGGLTVLETLRGNPSLTCRLSLHFHWYKTWDTLLLVRGLRNHSKCLYDCPQTALLPSRMLFLYWWHSFATMPLFMGFLYHLLPSAFTILAFFLHCLQPSLFWPSSLLCSNQWVNVSASFTHHSNPFKLPRKSPISSVLPSRKSNNTLFKKPSAHPHP